jgi:hypothetical protein
LSEATVEEMFFKRFKKVSHLSTVDFEDIDDHTTDISTTERREKC